MELKGKKIGIGITGSFCTINLIKDILLELKEKGAELYPFVTPNIESTDTRFRHAKDFIAEVEDVCGRSVVNNTADAEPYGPKIPLDIMVMLPMTGNSLAKLSHGMNDTAPLMAAKTTLRNLKPVVIAIFTNDALGISGQNIFKLINSKNIFFVPFGQDDYIKKPNSMTAKLELTVQTIESALEGIQLQPVIIENFH